MTDQEHAAKIKSAIERVQKLRLHRARIFGELNEAVIAAQMAGLTVDYSANLSHPELGVQMPRIFRANEVIA